MSDLVQPSVPRRVVLDAPVVNKDNVEEYLPLGFEKLTPLDTDVVLAGR